MKLVVLGGGGVRSPFLSKSIVTRAKKIGINKIVFMDNDMEKLRIYGGMSKHIANCIDESIEFILTSDPIEAVEDADFIITTLRVGQDEGRVSDERIALKYNILGQETTGAGGFAMSLRSIPALMNYCELIKKYSKKNAYIFNFTNPSGLVTQALRSAGYDNVYGICDGPSEFIKELQILTESRSDNFSVECFGLNHLSWFRKITVNGKDITKDIINGKELYIKTEEHLFDEKLVKMHKMLLNGYLYFYYYREKAVGLINRSGKTRGETILEINSRMNKRLSNLDIEKEFAKAFKIYLEHYYERENSYMSIESGSTRTKQVEVPDVNEFIEQEDEGGYAGVALNFIEAMQTDKEIEMVLSVPNNGSIEGLEDTDVVEITCKINKDGAVPVKIGKVEPLQMNLIRQVKLFERTTVEAIRDKSIDKAIEGLMVHPLVNSYSLAKQLVNEYLNEYKEYVGDWGE
ncbi:glycoside hydrolase [Vallitalea longa]|uniref:Glycoside hydrolase n=1 Tax=Vallitalea longa TaxID=2936439 RepID=A0A9W5Y9P0_9FIRM|nr:6-phospho-beta-glucosidase [Vallitalea longa]GKX27954.1 glycoside hydrolase [Vallitalea longa]